MNDYKFGYVAALDILGFGSYSSKKHNFSAIKSLMNDLHTLKEMQKDNFEEKICIMSDTIIITVDIDEDYKFDYVYFDNLVEWIARLMVIIKNRLGLFSRSSITIGDYYYDFERNIIFGPGIVRSVILAEKIDTIKEIDYVDKRLKNRPVAFIIDNLFFGNPNSIIRRKMFENMTLNSVNENNKYRHVGMNYFIYNTYFIEYECYMLNNKSTNSLGDFIKISKNRISEQSHKPGLEKKYSFEKICLNMFKRSHQKVE